MKSRTIFIWDIHWCFDELKLLLKKLKIEENDKVFFTWDLINKWPKSFKVIKLIYKNREQYKVVLWNHDLEFLEYIEKNKKTSKEVNTKYEKLKNKLNNFPDILEYFKKIPLYIEEKDFLLIHGWLIPWKLVWEHKAKEICYIRNYKWKPWYKQYKWDKKIIYWHWAIDWLNIREKTVWLDTWCCYWNFLTAYILETWEVLFQKALKQYINPLKKKSIFSNIIEYLKK